MRVADIMQTAVRTVASDTPVSELVVSLADARVTGLPVVMLAREWSASCRARI
jgi:CBS-domain-containing membrane protein